MDAISRLVLLWLVLITGWGWVHGQQMHWMRLAEDTAYYGKDYLPDGHLVTMGGPAQIWNFRSLKAPYAISRRVVVSGEREGTTYASLIRGSQSEAILRVNGKQSEIIQVIDDNPVCKGGRLTFNLSPAYKPFFNGVMGEKFMYRGRMNAVFAWPRHMTCSWTPERLPDSCRVTYTYTEDAVVDAEGTLYLPSESHQAFRHRVEMKKAIRVEAKNGAIWTDVTHAIPGIPLLTSTSILRFVSSASGLVLVEMEMEDGLHPVSVEFKTHPMLTRIFPEEPAKADVYAYPNPSYDLIRFQLNDLAYGSYTLKIFNILGVGVREMTVMVDHPRKTIVMDLSELQRGTYLYRLQDRNGRTIRTKRILLIQP